METDDVRYAQLPAKRLEALQLTAGAYDIQGHLRVSPPQ